MKVADDKCEFFIFFFASETVPLVFSGDLNTGLVWYLSGEKLSDLQMVRYLNVI